MADVQYVTLYLPDGTPVQVVEGGPLHALYVARGADGAPPTPGPVVRLDPFPQYVDQDELTQALGGAAASDTAVAALVNDTGSQTRGALGAALVPRPSGGADGQALVKSGTDVAWGTVAGGGGLSVNSAVKTDGTDQSTTLLAEISALSAAGGGTLVLPAGTIRVNSQVVIPQTGGIAKPIRITGQGAPSGNPGGAPAGGTILDLRYSGTGAKIASYGLGTLEIDHLALADLGTSSTAFVLCTGTTLMAHDLTVSGNPTKTGTACDQDAFILGGTTTTTTNDGPTTAFQGYGSVIERVSFDSIRRTVYGRVYANSVVYRNNMIQPTCGGDSTVGAVDFDCGGVGFSRSNLIEGNLFEMTNYAYGVRIGAAAKNVIVNNSFWDGDGRPGYLADVRLEAIAVDNTIISSGEHGTSPVSDANGGNMVILGGSTRQFLGGLTVQSIASGAGALTLKANSGAQVADILAIFDKSGNKTWAADSSGALTCGTNLGSTTPVSVSNNTAGGAAARFVNQFRGGVILGDGSTSTGALRVVKGDGTTEVARIDQNGCVKSGTAATGSRPAASSSGAGAMFFDTTLGKPIWSDGTSWKDATGTVV